jgi:photosystem II stability/assembly factor-like uncharacterized protein
MQRSLIFAAALAFLPAGVSAQQWQLLDAGTTASLRAVSAVNANIAWAGGSRGTVLRTTDAGGHWQHLSVPGADSLDFRSIHAFDSLTAVIASAGQPARIYRTEDGGRTWTVRHSDSRPGAFFDAMAFWDNRRGLVMSDPIDGHWLILKTSDGGKTWHDIPAGALPPALANEGGFAASNTCLTVAGQNDAWFATGGAGTSRVSHTSDGGKHWTVAATPVDASNPASGIFGIAFANPQHGVVVGGDYQKPRQGERNVAITSDGGRTWQSAGAFHPVGLVSGVVTVPATGGTFVATGESGSAYSLDNGQSWILIDSTALYAASFTSPSAGWAVGARGRVARLSGALPGVAESTHPRGGDAHE